MLNQRRRISVGLSKDVLEAGTHICYIYNDEKERDALIARFLEAGENENEKLVYVVEDIERARAQLTSAGIRVGDTPQWTFSHLSEVYLVDGDFTAESVLQSFKSFYDLAIREGFSGVRGSGDMRWVLRAKNLGNSPVEYEARVNLAVKTHPWTSICQYDAREFDGDTLFNMLSVHPYTIVGGQIVRNPYFIEPDVFLEKSRAGAARAAP